MTSSTLERDYSETRRPITLGILTIAVFFGGCGGWAATAPLDGAIIGGGSLAVHGNTKTIQHREGGIVSQILVQEGDVVARDQVLIKLDDTQVRASLNVHTSQLMGDQALYARNLAELSNSSEIVLPPNLDTSDPVVRSIVTREQVILTNRRLLLNQQIRVVDERLAQTRSQATGATAQHVSAMRALAFGMQQLQAMTSLERVGLAARNSVLELSRSIEALRGEAGQLESDINRHEAELAELETEKLRLYTATQGEATRESREAQLRIDDVLPRIAADRDLLNHLSIRAPVSGQVVDLQVFTKGGVIEPGKPILHIVPRTRDLVAISEIKPEDIEHVHLGSDARIIATGFNAKETQPVDGRIVSVSADRITDARTGRSFYTAEVALVDDHRAGSLMKQLGPGMPVEVVIPVKPRTALDYLLEPIRTSLRSAGREM